MVSAVTGTDDGERNMKESEVDQMLDDLGKVLEIPSQDAGNGMECIACESQPKRAEENVRDGFVKYQWLLCLDKYGSALHKKYKSYVWEDSYPMVVACNKDGLCNERP